MCCDFPDLLNTQECRLGTLRQIDPHIVEKQDSLGPRKSLKHLSTQTKLQGTQSNLPKIHTILFCWTISIHSPLVTLDPKGTYSTHAYLLRPARSTSESRHSLYVNVMYVIKISKSFTNNFKIIYKQFQNHFVEPPKPRL